MLKSLKQCEDHQVLVPELLEASPLHPQKMLSHPTKDYYNENLLLIVSNNNDKNILKVIPLKFFYYQTFFETWRNEHS